MLVMAAACIIEDCGWKKRFNIFVAEARMQLEKPSAKRIGMLSIATATLLLSQAHLALAQEPRLHVVIAADTLDGRIGQSVNHDVEWLKQIVHANAPRDRTTLRILQGNKLTKVSLMQTVQNLPVTAAVDAVFVYYSGHGDYGGSQMQHRLVSGRWQLERNEIRKAIQGHNPRVGALITDTCSSFQPTGMTAPIVPPTDEFSPSFQHLFFDLKGLADISSTRPAEAAVGTSNGGVFTFALYQVLMRASQAKMSWEDVVQETNKQLQEDRSTALLRGVPVQQTAYALSPLPVAATAIRSRLTSFGASVTRTEASALLGGVVVVKVLPNSPATCILGEDGKEYSLIEHGDIITRVNDVAVTTPDAFNAAVAKAGAKFVLTVYDVSTGNEGKYSVDLNSGPAKKKLQRNDFPSNKKMLGVIADRTAQSARIEGVEVRSVVPGSPATQLFDRDGVKYTLVPKRDIIVNVNGEPVRDDVEFVAAISRSPVDLVLRVYDLKTGRIADYEVDLRQ